MAWLRLVVLISPLTLLWAAVHGFHGTVCLHSYAQAGCGNNPHIPNSIIGIVSAAILLAATLTLLGNRRR